MRNLPFPLHGGSYRADSEGRLCEDREPALSQAASDQPERDAAAEAVDPIVSRRRGKRHED